MAKLLETIILVGFLGLGGCSESNNQKKQDTQDTNNSDVVSSDSSNVTAPLANSTSLFCDEESIVDICEAYCVNKFAGVESNRKIRDLELKSSRQKVRPTHETTQPTQPSLLELNSEQSPSSPQSPSSSQPQTNADTGVDSKVEDTISSLYAYAQESVSFNFAERKIHRARALAQLHGIDVTQFETALVQGLYAAAKKDLEKGRLAVPTPKIDYARKIAKERKIDISSQETTLVQTLYDLAQSNLEKGRFVVADPQIDYARNLAVYASVSKKDYEEKLIEAALRKAEEYIVGNHPNLSTPFVIFADKMAEYNSLAEKYQQRISLLREAIK